MAYMIIMIILLVLVVAILPLTMILTCQILHTHIGGLYQTKTPDKQEAAHDILFEFIFHWSWQCTLSYHIFKTFPFEHWLEIVFGFCLILQFFTESLDVLPSPKPAMGVSSIRNESFQTSTVVCFFKVYNAFQQLFSNGKYYQSWLLHIRKA